MKEFMIFCNDGTTIRVKAESEDSARDAVLDEVVDRHTSIFGVGDITPENTAVALGRKGGSAKTDAKRKASAENGKKGGRPKKETLKE